ncbi:DUF6959 family protein [Nevskia ramosa]|uniref:DUF6959 family protein n=1 Tax=Nevskia ramosa TaxID=64002 RepID=UPI003D124157
MPKFIELEVYSEVGNHWVVRTPGRQFPALVIQGDTLHGIYADLLELSQRLDALPAIDQEIRDEATAIASSMRERLFHYESVIEAAGFQLPYTKSVGAGT